MKGCMMKEIPNEIVKIIGKLLPKGNEQNKYDFISEEGCAVKLSIHRHPTMSGFVIRHEETKAAGTIYSFFSILVRGHCTSMVLWSYSVAEEWLSKEGKRLPKEWTVSTEVTPRMVDFDAFHVSLQNTPYSRKYAFIEGLERLSELAQEEELSKFRLR